MHRAVGAQVVGLYCLLVVVVEIRRALVLLDELLTLVLVDGAVEVVQALADVLLGGRRCRRACSTSSGPLDSVRRCDSSSSCSAAASRNILCRQVRESLVQLLACQIWQALPTVQ